MTSEVSRGQLAEMSMSAGNGKRHAADGSDDGNATRRAACMHAAVQASTITPATAARL